MPRAWAAASVLATCRMMRSASGIAQSPDAGQSLVERLALEQLHDDVGRAIDVVTDVEDLHDAGVADRVRGAGLVEEALHDLALERVLGVEDLDAARRPSVDVLGNPDLTHAAGPDLLHHAKHTDLSAGQHDRSTSTRHNRRVK